MTDVVLASCDCSMTVHAYVYLHVEDIA